MVNSIYDVEPWGEHDGVDDPEANEAVRESVGQ
jgi:hypothetical protein